MTEGQQLAAALEGLTPGLAAGPAIHSACWHGSVEVVKVLLEFKADLEARPSPEPCGARSPA